MSSDSRSTESRPLAYCQLLRLPNVFTAMADVAMGFLFVHRSLAPFGTFALLLVASTCLYSAGMVLNDVYDIEQDRRERPGRPLASGRIDRDFAARLGWGLLLSGVVAGACAAALSGVWRPAMVIALLAALIVLYDGVLKRTVLGPIVMGSCRGLNVLLGMSAAERALGEPNWIVVIGITLYVTGITWFARREAGRSRQTELVGALLMMLTGMLALWWFPIVTPDEQLTYLLQFEPWHWTAVWTILVVLISGPFLRAIFWPEPANVQTAVKAGILSIVVIDAVVVFVVCGAAAAIGILLLLIPSILLGRFVYST